MSEAILPQALRCPACAAPVEVPAGDVLRCPYCGIESRLGRAPLPQRAAAQGPANLGLVVGGSVVASIVVGALLFVGGSDEPAPVSASAPPSQQVSAAAVPEPVAAPVPVPIAVEPEVEPFDMFSAEPPPDAVEVHWQAKVTKSSGPHKKGAACEIVAHVSNGGDTIRPLDLRCGDALLYSTTQKFSGMSNMSTGATKTAAKDGSARYVLRFSDVGSRELRAQIRIDSASGIARVWNDELPPLDIELAVDKEGAPPRS